MNTIRPGAVAFWRNEACVVLEIKGLTEAVIRTASDQSTHVVRASELTTTPVSNVGLTAHHVFAESHAWDLATERYELIRPLLGNGRNSLENVKAVADASGKSTGTIYRWIKRFNQTGLVSSLLRSARSDTGDLRLDEEVEYVINKCIQENYLIPERPKITSVYVRIEVECKALGLAVPHINTVHQRVRAIDEKERHRRRHGPRSANQIYKPLRGTFPETKFPNEIIQIDHTPVDVILVDEENRLPIGRPYLTMGIQVHTRMITGFCLTLDHPSSTSAAICIAHSVMKKDFWLAKRDISAEWPVYGLMQKIHVDNAKEFRGSALTRGCEEYGVTLEYRPKGQPNYGPHIERVFRTFMSETHNIPGTTFSSIKERGDYKSEGKACFTLAELELWITVFIVYVYHNRKHKGICNVPPINLYAQCVHGTREQPGVGLPEPIENEEKLRLDFMPYETKTVQRRGIVWDYINYYAPVLKRRINEKGHDGKGRKFVVVRDPRDISVLYFLDPDDATYYPIPYSNANRPSMSQWELNESIDSVKEAPNTKVTEDRIFEGHERLIGIQRTAVEKTRLATQARSQEKRKRRKEEQRKHREGVHYKPTSQTALTMVMDEAGHEDIQPFDIEIG